MNKLILNRRTFLKDSLSIGGGLFLLPGHIYTTGLNKLEPEGETFWYLKPLRILQTVLREVDAVNYSAVQVVDYMLETGCNALVVNAGGIVDFFQNPLDGANINRFMGTRDILKEITDACQSAGIRVIGRIDFRGVEEHVYKKYPDWFSIDVNGKPIQLSYTRPQLYASCYTGYYRNEHADQFIHYLLENYALDGIWHNSIGVGSICHCTRCNNSFRSAMGESIPDMVTASSAELDHYMQWKTGTADHHMERMKHAVKSHGDDKVYTAEVFSMFESGSRINSGIDLYNARDHFDFLVSVAFLTENSEHIQYEDLHYASTIVRFLKSMSPEKEAIILYGGNGTAHRYVMDPPVDLKIWLWEAISAGGRFWNCNFTGMHPGATYDRRNAYNHSEAYHFVKEHEKFLARQAPVANIGIYYSRPTRLFYRSATPEADRFEDAIKGVEMVLIENHIPYDFVPDDQLSAQQLRKYRLVILPNVRCLSDREMELLRDFVRSGGTLIASYATSLYTEAGLEREDFGLADLFGCHYKGERVNTRKDNYQFIVQPDHPVIGPEGRDTELLLNAGFTLLCTTQESAQVILTHVPTVHNQPPEKAWVDEWSEEYPTLVQNSFGNGTVLYFANQPDRISYEIGHQDARLLLLRAIRHLAGTAIPIETSAPESVHIGLTESIDNNGKYILSLVNTTSAPVRPIRQLAPLFDLQVKVHLEGSSLKNYQVLRSQGDCQVDFQSGIATVMISRLEDFCCVYLEMEV